MPLPPLRRGCVLLRHRINLRQPLINLRDSLSLFSAGNSDFCNQTVDLADTVDNLLQCCCSLISNLGPARGFSD